MPNRVEPESYQNISSSETFSYIRIGKRHRRRMWNEGQSNWGGRKRRIVLSLEDLGRTQLHLPNEA
jgi:hypothetical protein